MQQVARFVIAAVLAFEAGNPNLDMHGRVCALLAAIGVCIAILSYSQSTKSKRNRRHG